MTARPGNWWAYDQVVTWTGTASAHRAPADAWTSTEVGAHLRGRRTKDTAPELGLRRALHALGLRYRLGRKVGRYTPDLIFPRSRTTVFVDGCFWHGCPEHGPKTFRGPNATRWADKISANRQRDLRASTELTSVGWHVVRIWECAVKKDTGAAAEQVRRAVQRASAGDSSA